MAIHWLAAVPWKEIIANAPRIVEGAKVLSSYLKKPGARGAIAGETEEVGDMEQEVAALKAKVRELEAMQASLVKVVQSLAENSEQVADALGSLKKQAVLNFRLALACLLGLAVVGVVLALQ